ncbi:hypothetical protein [Noviherbaspirillum massiliense]|uniref:hypothetical protein n=1 Tax=Noviherbaspirillum massiliense TaxID=1465823 RepID=UPI0003701EFC|nr:hypothetical protein [Noviherbaspirillum massiliense]
MKSWRQALRDGAVSGSVASVLSTAALSAYGEQEDGTPYGPTNAISHWFWGRRATQRDGPSMRYTALGYAIHHASSTFWAVIYEKWLGEHAEQKSLVPAFAGGTAIAGLACFVDYTLTPRRLRPGFEQRLPRRSLFVVYAAFGLGLALRGMVASEESRMESPRRHCIPAGRP